MAAEEFEIGEFYTNDDIAKLGGNPQMFLAATKDAVVAGRFREDQNQELPDKLFVETGPGRKRVANRFRQQSNFIPVFVQPTKTPHHGSSKWRYDGRWRVANRTVDPVKDADEVRTANAKWNPKPKFSMVLHLEPESDLNKVEATAAAEGAFDPTNLEDARESITTSIVRRRGRPAFRRKLIQAYGGRCAVSDCDCVDALEGAHIYPYRGSETDHVTNGLLLRADIHTLFDLGKISVDVTDYTLIVAPSLRDTTYGKLHGARLHLPSDPTCQPNRQVLSEHRKKWGL